MRLCFMRVDLRPCVLRCATFGLTLLSVCRVAWGQCVMCAQNAQATATATGGYQPLAIAALVLLVPTLLILVAGAILVWRLREPATLPRPSGASGGAAPETDVALHALPQVAHARRRAAH